MKHTNKKGFTLVELVIVIAVIAILAAVLIPTFSNIIASANENAAMQNARTALTDYVSSLGANVPEEIDVLILSGEYYFVVDNGQLKTSAEASRPDGYKAAEEGTFNNCKVYAKTVTP